MGLAGRRRQPAATTDKLAASSEDLFNAVGFAPKLHEGSTVAYNGSRMDVQLSLGRLIDPVDDEVVAALAAVEAYLAVEQPALPQDRAAPADEPWRDSAKLVVQRLQPGRTRTTLRWSTIERVRRDNGGSSGVIGL